MDNSSLSSGRISETANDHERGKMKQATKTDNESMTLMRLRRLSSTIMCKSVRHRFEAQKLQRSNVVKFLEGHLTHPSEKVRYLTLEVFCCTMPRLTGKTDILLKPLLPKVYQCLQKGESKDMKLKALHFLRGFFRHTESLSGFIKSYVELGIENSDVDIQIACCLGLNIVFDQDIGNRLLTPLIISVANIFKRSKETNLNGAAYRALRQIHNTIKDVRFFYLLSNAHPEAAETYKDSYNYEEADSFLALDETDCSAVVLEYQIKSNYFNFNKHFGILDQNLLLQIQQTRNCERAAAVHNFAKALKQAYWTDEELQPHMMDFLKVVNSFFCDLNRLVQMSGFDILKEVIGRMSFTLSPHIQYIVGILRQGLTCANTKIRSKVHHVLHRLMHNIHPMTVIWNLLSTKNASQIEAVLMYIQKKLNHFPYYEIDMVALCNYLSQNLEDTNSKLAKCSKDCMILLFDIMGNCPAHRIKIEAINVLLRNHKFCTDTLNSIGIKHSPKEDYKEEFESYTDEETTDIDSSSIPVGSIATDISIATSCRSISTVIESMCDYARSDLSLAKSCMTIPETASCCNLKSKTTFLNENLNKREKIDKDLDLHPQITIQASIDWKKNLIASTNTVKSAAESSTSSIVKERILYSGLDSIPSKSFCSSFDNNNEMRICKMQLPGFVTPDRPKSSPEYKIVQSSQNMNNDIASERRSPEIDSTSHENYFIENESGISQFANVIVSENVDVLQKLNSGSKPRRYFTRFCVAADNVSYLADSAKQAAGDANIFSKNTPLNLPQESHTEINPSLVSTPYEQVCNQTDVMNNAFDFDILQVTHSETNEGMEEADHNEHSEYKTIEPSMTLKRITESTLQLDMHEISQKSKYIQENEVPKFKVTNMPPLYETSSNFFDDIAKSEISLQSQSVIESNLRNKMESETEIANASIDDKESLLQTPRTECSITGKESSAQMDPYLEEVDVKCTYDAGKNLVSDTNSLHEGIDTSEEASYLYSTDFEEIETPFLPKSRKLPRTPVKIKIESSFEEQQKVKKNSKKCSYSNRRKAVIQKNQEKESGFSNEDQDASLQKSVVRTPNFNRPDTRSCSVTKHNSPSKWGGCQWRRDLEYAAKAAPCSWADKFENVVQSTKPFPSADAAESEIRKAIEDLLKDSWKEKEEAMLTIIQLARHHSEVVHEYTSKIAVALSNEIKNFRQSVAGKAILTIGFLYEIMGKHFENKLRLVVSALLTKSGNRTLAAYFRLVIKSLFKIMNSASPQKVAMAFIQEGSRQANKAARETAAQFLTILTEQHGPRNKFSTAVLIHILKCAAMFVADSSALTRYCGKRIFKELINHPEFEKLKDHHLEVTTAQNLSKLLKELKSSDVRQEILPINIIE